LIILRVNSAMWASRVVRNACVPYDRLNAIAALIEHVAHESEDAV